ncbi:MAG: hypothetical protein JOS17DRAFT_757672 [Linnemannia elongata]|nr:MAG: hypothetical protein JOS17DRAFT_757672 [Linnemannia elongata]
MKFTTAVLAIASIWVANALPISLSDQPTPTLDDVIYQLATRSSPKGGVAIIDPPAVSGSPNAGNTVIQAPVAIMAC